MVVPKLSHVLPSHREQIPGCSASPGATGEGKLEATLGSYKMEVMPHFWDLAALAPRTVPGTKLSVC